MRARRTARRGWTRLAGAVGVLAALGAQLPATAGAPPLGAAVQGGSTFDGTPTRPIPTRHEVLYAVSAHPDDEPVAWWLIENRPRAYAVFVLLTQGEQTEFCMPAHAVPHDRRVGDPGLAPSAPTADEAGDGDLGDDGELAGATGTGAVVEGFDKHHLDNAGPWAYQGPGSPVGEPDKGERHPLGNPWQGKGTQACKDARVASWHWFLDAMAAHDQTGAMASMGVVEDPRHARSYRGRFCDHGAKRLGCARVWATGDGARVVFDAGDLQLSADEVVRALDLVRHRRRAWGLPVLREAGVVAAVPGPGPVCADHPDHAAVRDAVHGHDFGAGPQWGVACDQSDPRFQAHPAPPEPFDPVDLRMNMIDPATERRQGTFNTSYGWLFDTYHYAGSTGLAWRRFR